MTTAGRLRGGRRASGFERRIARWGMAFVAPSLLFFAVFSFDPTGGTPGWLARAMERPASAVPASIAPVPGEEFAEAAHHEEVSEGAALYGRDDLVRKAKHGIVAAPGQQGEVFRCLESLQGKCLLDDRGKVAPRNVR